RLALRPVVGRELLVAAGLHRRVLIPRDVVVMIVGIVEVMVQLLLRSQFVPGRHIGGERRVAARLLPATVEAVLGRRAVLAIPLPAGLLVLRGPIRAGESALRSAGIPAGNGLAGRVAFGGVGDRGL